MHDDALDKAFVACALQNRIAPVCCHGLVAANRLKV
jgi:hypothetical protein